MWHQKFYNQRILKYIYVPTDFQVLLYFNDILFIFFSFIFFIPLLSISFNNKFNKKQNFITTSRLHFFFFFDLYSHKFVPVFTTMKSIPVWNKIFFLNKKHWQTEIKLTGKNGYNRQNFFYGTTRKIFFILSSLTHQMRHKLVKSWKNIKLLLILISK